MPENRRYPMALDGEEDEETSQQQESVAFSEEPSVRASFGVQDQRHNGSRAVRVVTRVSPQRAVGSDSEEDEELASEAQAVPAQSFDEDDRPDEERHASRIERSRAGPSVGISGSQAGRSSAAPAAPAAPVAPMRPVEQSLDSISEALGGSGSSTRMSRRPIGTGCSGTQSGSGEEDALQSPVPNRDRLSEADGSLPESSSSPPLLLPVIVPGIAGKETSDSQELREQSPAPSPPPVLLQIAVAEAPADIPVPQVRPLSPEPSVAIAAVGDKPKTERSEKEEVQRLAPIDEALTMPAPAGNKAEPRSPGRHSGRGRASHSEEEGDLSSGTSVSNAWLGNSSRSEGAALKDMMRHSKHKHMIRKLIPSFPSPEEHTMQHSAPSSTRSLRSNSSSSSSAAASNDRAMESDRFVRFTCDLANKIDKEEEARASMVEQLFRLQQKALEKKVREKLRHLQAMEEEKSPRWLEKKRKKVRMRAEAEHAEIERQLAESKALHARRKLRLSEMENQVYSWRSSTLRLKTKSSTRTQSSDPDERGPERPGTKDAQNHRRDSPFSSGYSTPSSSSSKMPVIMPAALTAQVAAIGRASVSLQSHHLGDPGRGRLFDSGVSKAREAAGTRPEEVSRTPPFRPLRGLEVSEGSAAAPSSKHESQEPNVKPLAGVSDASAGEDDSEDPSSEGESINTQVRALRRDMEVTKLQIKSARSMQEKEAKYAILQRQKEAARRLYEQKQNLVSERVRLIQLEQEEQEVNALLDMALKLNVEEEVQRQITETVVPPLRTPAVSTSEPAVGVLTFPEPPAGEWAARESHLERLRSELAEKRKAVDELHAERQRLRQTREEQHLLRELQKVQAEEEMLRRSGDSDAEELVAASPKAVTSPKEPEAPKSASPKVSASPKAITSPKVYVSDISEGGGGQALPDAIEELNFTSTIAALRATFEKAGTAPLPPGGLLATSPPRKPGSSSWQTPPVPGAGIGILLEESAEDSEDYADDHDHVDAGGLLKETSLASTGSDELLLVEEVELMSGRQDPFHVDEWLQELKGPGRDAEERRAKAEKPEAERTLESKAGDATVNFSDPTAKIEFVEKTAPDLLEELLAEDAFQTAHTLRHPTPITAAALLTDMLTEDGASSVESETAISSQVSSQTAKVEEVPSPVLKFQPKSRVLEKGAETVRHGSQLSPKDAGPPRPPSPPPEGSRRSREETAELISGELLEGLLGEVWSDLAAERAKIGLRPEILPKTSPVRSRPAPAAFGDQAVLAFLETALPLLGVVDEASPVSHPLQPTSMWMPTLLESMQLRELRGQEKQITEGAVTDVSHIESFSRLLADALVEFAGEEVKPGPRVLGWRRPGFGEPPLARFKQKEDSDAVSSKMTWEKVRGRLVSAVRFGSSVRGEGALAADSDFTGNMPSAGATLFNIDEGIDALLEEEICSDEASWLDIEFDVRQVKNQVVQMIFAELIDEMAAEVTEIWTA